MSVISLELAKQYLDVIHNADDAKLQMLLDGAEDEASQFMNRGLLEVPPTVLVADGVPVAVIEEEQPTEPAPSMVLGVMLLLQAAYQATPEDAEKLRKAAEVKLQPYRVGMGV